MRETAEEFARDGENVAETAYRFLEQYVLTEAGTDAALAWMESRIGSVRLWKVVPVPTRLIIGLLDSWLPEKLLGMLRAAMEAQGWLPDATRTLHPDNPFRP